MRALLLPPLVLLLLSGCNPPPPVVPSPGADAAAAPGPDAALPPGPDAGLPDAAEPPGLDAAEPLDASLPVATDAGLSSVEPPVGGCSVATEVVLHGQGLRPVARVEVGGVAATDVELIDSATLRASFPPVALTARGKRLVSVVFEDRTAVSLADGFEYVFDEDPVVFVHGFMLSPFGTMIDRFKEAGYPEELLFRIEYSDVYGSSLVNAQELKAFVADVLNRTGAPRVDLVIHSMGGLSSRLYLWDGGDAFVRDYVGIAGAFHGTNIAYATWSDGAKEMRPPYSCDGESLNNVQFDLNGCLTEKGRTFFVDETPFGVEEGGPISYLSISSEQDEFILPSESACLNQRFQGDCADAANVRVKWLGHATILTDQDVFDTTLAHLRRRNRSKP